MKIETKRYELLGSDWLEISWPNVMISENKLDWSAIRGKVKATICIDGKFSSIKDLAAEILKYLIDNEGMVVSSSQFPNTFAHTNHYKVIIEFLGKYGNRVTIKRGRNGGVVYNSTPGILVETKPVETKTLSINEVELTADDENITEQKMKAPLWEASRRDYRRKLGGRFRGLGLGEIIEKLLPTGVLTAFDVQASVAEESGSVITLIERHKNKNLSLVGMGGIGKTTALVHRLHDSFADGIEYCEDCIVPIYIELNKAPEQTDRIMSLKDRRSTFILRYIASLLTGKDYGEISASELEPLCSEFSRESGQPEYLFLLDGLNEVSSKWQQEISGSVQGLLIQEIREILKEFHNVRVIITSRTEHYGIESEHSPLVKIKLSGITDKIIFERLEQCNKAHLIDIVKSNSALLECLHTPLFLMMYCGINNAEEVSTRGAILREFWHEVSQIYSQRTVADSISSNREISAQMLMFIVDFVAPVLCDEMERNSAFSIDEDKAIALIEQLLVDDSAFGLRSNYAKRCFVRYSQRSSGYHEDVASVAGRLATLDRSAQHILLELENMGILYFDDDEEIFGIRHHYYRDYFAAVHSVNSFELARFMHTGDKKIDARADLAFDCLSPLRCEPLRRERATLIGEYLDEDKNMPVQDDDGKWHYTVPLESPCRRNLIHRVLDIFRGRFDDNVGYGVYNLVNILKLTRKALAGEDFSYLDFSHGSLNGAKPGMPGLGANLTGAKLRRGALFCEGHTGAITCAQFSPDGTRIVTASEDGTAKIWDARSGECLRKFEAHFDQVRMAKFSPDCTRILTISKNLTAKVWDASTGMRLSLLENDPKSIYSASFSPDGTKIITESVKGTINVTDAYSGEVLVSFDLSLISAPKITYSPDGSRIATLSYDGILNVWDSATSDLTFSVMVGYEFGYSLSFSHDGTKLLTVSRDGILNVWNSSTGESIISFKVLSSRNLLTAISPDGTRIATASSRDLNVWDSSTGELLISFRAHSELVLTVAFSLDSNRIVTASTDRTVKVWNASTGELLTFCDGYTRSVVGVLLNSDYSNVVTSYYDCTTKLWETSTGGLLDSYKEKSQLIRLASFSLDGKRIITFSKGNIIRIRDKSSNKLLASISHCGHRVHFAKLSLDGTRIITITNDRIIDVWNAYTGEKLVSFEAASGLISDALFSYDNKLITTIANKEKINLWDASNGEMLISFEAKSRSILSASFNSDASRIVIVNANHSTEIWDVSSQKMLVSLKKSSDKIRTVSYSPDGTMILTASDDRIAKLWNSSTGDILTELKGHSDKISFALFIQDGSKIVTTSYDGTAKIWDVSSGECIATFPHHYGLSVFECDLRALHPDSRLSDDDLAVLRQYGAILD